MMSRTGGARRILGIWRKLVGLRQDTERDGWLSLAHEALWQVPHEIGGRWKSQNRKIVPLSPYVEKPLNSKVIKSFVPKLRSRYVFFSNFDIPMFYLYGHSMYVSHILWLWYIDIFGARARHIRIMGMVRLGYQRDDQAKNIGSISSCLFRRWKEREREKTQGP